MPEKLDTWFAPAHRATPESLSRRIGIVSSNEVIDALLAHSQSLVAVLDDHRQILAVNESYLEFLGVEDAGQVLGLRVGEAIGCTHAEEMPGGCGTSAHCMSCGAAIAIVTSLANGEPVRRTCALEAEKNGETIELRLEVHAVPLPVDGRSFVLLYLDDVT